jgi:hypothetical protein
MPESSTFQYNINNNILKRVKFLIWTNYSAKSWKYTYVSQQPNELDYYEEIYYYEETEALETSSNFPSIT